MKKIKFIFLLCFILIECNSFALKKTLRVGVSVNNSPFCSFDKKKNEFKGYSIDVFDSICSRLNINYVYVPLDNNNFSYTCKQLINDSVDLIINATYFIKNKSLTYSFPYFHDRVNLFSYKELSTKERAIYTNKKIGIFYKELKNVCDSSFPDKKGNFILFRDADNLSEKIKIVKNHSCEAFLCNKIPFMDFLKNNKLQGVLYNYPVDIFYEKHAIAVTKKDTALLNKIDNVLLEIISPSFNKKLYSKWINNEDKDGKDKKNFIKLLYILLSIVLIYIIYILISLYIKHRLRKDMISYFSMLLNAVPYPIVIRNANNLEEIIFSNKATLDVFGTNGKLDLKKTISESTINKLTQKVKKIISNGKSNFCLEKYVFFNGEVNYFNVKRTIIETDGLKLLVTTRYKVNDLVNNTLKAQKAEKLKSIFLSNMSHEIRTPLNAIVGFSTLLIEEKEKEEIDKYKIIIENNTTLLLQLITDVIDLSQLESGIVKMDYQWVDFKELMNELFVVYKQNIKVTGKDIVLDFDDMYESFSLYVDKRSITQIITNFLNNAVKYTLEGVIQFGYYVLDGETYIYVKDTGIGIPKSKIKFVFKRFEKLSDIAAGSGLGMSISASIASAMNGEIDVKSKENKGSIFWVQLPLKFKKQDKVDTNLFSSKEIIKRIIREIKK